MAIDEGDLRKALRKVFDKFDADGSGSVSIGELSAMVDQLKMDVPHAKRRQMLIDADPDRSGEIDFEEFVTFIKAQMSKGATGGLAEVVKEAAGFFGLFSGFFSFFSGFGGGSGDASKPAAAPATASPTARAVETNSVPNTGRGMLSFFGGDGNAIVKAAPKSQRSPSKHAMYSLRVERKMQETERRRRAEREFQRVQIEWQEKEARAKAWEKEARVRSGSLAAWLPSRVTPWLTDPVQPCVFLHLLRRSRWRNSRHERSSPAMGHRAGAGPLQVITLEHMCLAGRCCSFLGSSRLPRVGPERPLFCR